MAEFAYRLTWLGDKTRKLRSECGKFDAAREKYHRYEISANQDGAPMPRKVGITWASPNSPSTPFWEWAYDGKTQADFTESEWTHILELLVFTISDLGHDPLDHERALKIQFWREDTDDDDKGCRKYVSETIDKIVDEEALEEAAEAAALREEIERDPHATLYVASMNVSINSETGLINQGAFKLRWNDLEKVSEWRSGVKSKYIAIQKGEVEDNSVALMREQVWLPPVWDFKTYNSYADLNTGKHQQSPTVRRLPTPHRHRSDLPTFRVSYGNSNAPVGEERGLKNKYKRFSGRAYPIGMALAIDDIVKVAMKGMRPKSEFNFKQVDTNTRFQKEFLSLFNERATATETVDTTTSATIMRAY